MVLRRALVLPVLLALTAGTALAQVPDVPADPEPALPSDPPFRFEGQVGTYLEMYETSGRFAQRPSATARLFLNSVITLFGSVTVGVDVLASTEGSSALGSATPGSATAPGRQSLNQVGVTPRWDWGRAYLGSFTDSYTPLTWSGTAVRGAGFAVEPGPLRVAAFGGRSQRAVDAGATYGAFDRTMVGGRLGVGSGSAEDGGGSWLDLIFLRASDDASSLPPPPELLEDEPPDLFSDTFPGPPVNPFAVTPQENVVMATAGALSLLEGALVLRGELGGALHTRDKRATELDGETLDRFPSLLTGFVTPRVSTSGDYAYTTEAQMRLPLPGATDRSPRTLSLDVGHRYIGPGYVSLGAPSLLSDQRAFELRSRVRARSWTAGLTGARQQDNLIGQKLATTTRHRLTGNLLVRPKANWTATFRAAFLDMGNDAADPERRVDYTNWIAETGHTVTLGRTGLFRRAGIRYAFRRSGDANPLRTASGLVAHSVSAQSVLQPADRLTLTPSIGLVESRSGEGGWSTRETYGLAARYSLLEGRWTAAGSLSRAALERSSSTRASLSARLRVTSQDEVVFGLRANHLNHDLEDRPDSEEYTATLEVRRRLGGP